MNEKREYDFIYFTKKERKGILLIVVINFIIWFSPNITHFLFFDSDISNGSFYKELTLPIHLKNDTPYHNIDRLEEVSNNNSSIRKFQFDPNTISASEWQQLGVSKKTNITIAKYLSKGGRFKKAADLYKIWGLSKKTVDQLIPFVMIKEDFKKADYVQSERKQIHNKIETSFIDINLADSALFETLSGIGPKLSHRIVLFREKIGGFYDVNQISEVWGLQDSTFQKIKNKLIVTEFKLKKININTSAIEQYKAHPYIGYKLGYALINYRAQHGSFQSLDDIQKIASIDEKSYNKMKHYLTVE